MSDRTERRERTSTLVQNMLGERHELLSLLVEISNKHGQGADKHIQERLNEFCQVLVDYIAAGHFGLYKRISDGRERRKNVADLAMKVYARIEETTEAALTFNEKYDSARKHLDLSNFSADISRLGEVLSMRIELEDRLIEGILSQK